MKHHSMKVRDAIINSTVMLSEQFFVEKGVVVNRSRQLGFRRNCNDTTKAMIVTVEMIIIAAVSIAVSSRPIAIAKDVVADMEETKR